MQLISEVKLHVQHRFHRSAVFASQSAVAPMERAVLKAKLSMLLKVFVPKTNELIIAEKDEENT